MRYEILQSSSTTDLQAQVQERLDKGWVLAGGLSLAQMVQRDGYGNQWNEPWYTQAVLWEHRNMLPPA